MLKYLICFYCVLLSFASIAQTNRPTVWSLQNCIDYAYGNNLQIRQQSLALEQDKVQAVQAQHSRLPNLNANVGHNYNWGRSFDVFTNAPVTQRVQSNNFNIGSSVTLFDGFRISNTIKQSQLQVLGSEHDLEAQKNNMALNVVTAFVTILFNRENLDNSRRQLQNTVQQIERTTELVNAGVLPERNLLDLNSQKASDEVFVVQNENTLQISKLQLKQLLQLDDVSTEEFEIQIPDVNSPSIIPPNESVEMIYTEAENTLPQIKSAEVGVQAAELGIDIAKANYYPTLTLSGNVSTFYSSAQTTQVRRNETGETTTVPIGFFISPVDGSSVNVFSDVPETELIVEDFSFADQLDESLRRNIGFNLQIPIYNRHQAKTAVENARIQREQARVNVAIAKNQLRQDVENAYYDVLAATNTFNASTMQVGALKETFRVSEQQYNAGVINVVDFQIARNNLANAEADLIRAKYDLIFRRKVLDFYLGNELKF